MRINAITGMGAYGKSSCCPLRSKAYWIGSMHAEEVLSIKMMKAWLLKWDWKSPFTPPFIVIIQKRKSGDICFNCLGGPWNWFLTCGVLFPYGVAYAFAPCDGLINETCTLRSKVDPSDDGCEQRGKTRSAGAHDQQQLQLKGCAMSPHRDWSRAVCASRRVRSYSCSVSLWCGLCCRSQHSVYRCANCHWNRSCFVCVSPTRLCKLRNGWRAVFVSSLCCFGAHSLTHSRGASSDRIGSVPLAGSARSVDSVLSGRRVAVRPPAACGAGCRLALLLLVFALTLPLLTCLPPRRSCAPRAVPPPFAGYASAIFPKHRPIPRPILRYLIHFTHP